MASAQKSGTGGGGPSGPGVLDPTLALKIPNETAPPDGVVQMKFLNTEPTPISSGRPHSFYDSSMFDAVWGIQLFNPYGDLNGVAIVNGTAVTVSFISTGQPQGTDYPVMTMALHVRPDAAAGRQMQFDLDPSSTWDVNGLPATMKPILPATVTVGGTVSITNVIPGGGYLPAGSIVRVEGLGFQKRTQVQLSGVQSQSVVIASPTEIQIELAQPTDMTGKKIQVVNPDGSQDTYFSYLRGIDLGSSSEFLLASAIPIFSSVTHSEATFSLLTAESGQFNGLAIQNQNLTPANVTATLYSSEGDQMGASTITIPSGYRLMREISELTGASVSPDSYVVIAADEPIQVFGFLGDDNSQTITPFAATSAKP